MVCPSCGAENLQGQRFCGNCGHQLEEQVRPAAEVRKTVTVVFCDVSGSTALGEQLDPESFRDVQSRYFDAMRAAIERHGGTVEKYIGDAVMAVFGIPRLHEDDALRAARAAIDMREAIADLNKELERDRGVTIQVRIGVNTGEVVAGDAVSGQAFVTGDAVNTAARLQQEAAPGDILIGELTQLLVAGAVDTQSTESLDLKGKAERVAARRLVRVRDISSLIPRHLDSPMVGRKSQLGQLQQAFQTSAEDAACHLFTLLGQAGIGKSRLVQEFLASLGNAVVLRGRCLPYGQGITYFPVVEAIKQAVGLADFNLPDVITERVCSVLEGEEHQELICRHVSQLMGAAQAVSGDETFWAIRRFFEAIARKRPLVLVFDDIHWGEPTFLDLLEHIADWSRDASILLLCIARSELLELRPAWGGGKSNATVMSLEPLSGHELESLIANLLDSADLPAPIAERIIETAEGNPLFVEQTLKMLVDDGLVQLRHGGWVVTRGAAAADVPPSIQALLAARIDGLTPGERAVLEAAAVIGRQFLAAAVHSLVPEVERPSVRPHLVALVGKDLIRPASTSLTGEEAFSFRHLLVRDSAYNSITKTRRAELHERFADWLQRVAGAGIAEQEEILAYHLEQAQAHRLQLGPPDDRTAAIGRRAAAHFATSGRRAANRGDWAAAANLFRRAAAIIPAGDAERTELLSDLGDAMEWFDSKVAFDAFGEALELAKRDGDLSAEWRARIRRSHMQMLVAPHSLSTDRFRAELKQATRVFDALRDGRGLATVWGELATIEWTVCRYSHSDSAGRLAIGYARSGNRRELLTPLSLVIASSVFGTSTPEEGLATLEEFREDISRDRWLESWCVAVEGYHRSMQGHPDEARRLILLGKEMLEAIGLAVSGVLQFLGDTEMRAGDPVAAEHAWRLSYEATAIGDEAHRSTAAACLASALCALGRYDEAERYALTARDVAAEDDLASQIGGRSVQALALAGRGELSEADRLSQEALDLSVDVEAPNMRGDAWMDRARVLLAAGKPAAAKDAAREALALYERKGNLPSSASTRSFIEALG